MLPDKFTEPDKAVDINEPDKNSLIETTEIKTLYDLENEARSLQVKLRIISSNQSSYARFFDGFLLYILFTCLGFFLVLLVTGHVYLSPTDTFELRFDILFLSILIIAAISFICIWYRFRKYRKFYTRREIARDLLERLVDATELVADYNKKKSYFSLEAGVKRINSFTD